MIPLTKEEEKMHNKQNRFTKDNKKVRDYYHYKKNREGLLTTFVI